MSCILAEMNTPGALEALLVELETFGQNHDRNCPERSRRMLNITRDTGEFLAVLVQAAGARRVLEIGTSNGYSTLWLALGVKATGGGVTSVEISDDKVSLAAQNFRRSGLQRWITLVHNDAMQMLARCQEGGLDFVFLDAERTAYPAWWPHLRRVLRLGGLLVVDNAVSHGTELGPFMTLVRREPAFCTSLVPVGKGEFLAVKGSGCGNDAKAAS